jgi:hypothetical protein
MFTESLASPSPTSTIRDDPDPPDDEQIDSRGLTKTVRKRHFVPLWLRLSPDFARLQGSNILIAMGIVLFLLGCEAFVIGHTTVAAFFVPLGLLAVVVAARMEQLVKIKIGNGIAEFVEDDATDDEFGSDAAPDA